MCFYKTGIQNGLLPFKCNLTSKSNSEWALKILWWIWPLNNKKENYLNTYLSCYYKQNGFPKLYYLQNWDHRGSWNAELFNVIWLTGGLTSEMEEDMIAYKKITDKFQDGIHFEESEMWLVGNGSLWPYAMKELNLQFDKGVTITRHRWTSGRSYCCRWPSGLLRCQI